MKENPEMGYCLLIGDSTKRNVSGNLTVYKQKTLWIDDLSNKKWTRHVELPVKIGVEEAQI